MKRTRAKRKRQQGCKIVETIKTVEDAAAAAVRIYKAVEPITKAIIKNWGRIK